MSKSLRILLIGAAISGLAAGTSSNAMVQTGKNKKGDKDQNRIKALPENQARSAKHGCPKSGPGK